MKRYKGWRLQVNKIEFFLAKLLGRKNVNRTDWGNQVFATEYYLWRGRVYVTKCTSQHVYSNQATDLIAEMRDVQ